MVLCLAADAKGDEGVEDEVDDVEALALSDEGCPELGADPSPERSIFGFVPLLNFRAVFDPSEAAEDFGERGEDEGEGEGTEERGATGDDLEAEEEGDEGKTMWLLLFDIFLVERGSSVVRDFVIADPEALELRDRSLLEASIEVKGRELLDCDATPILVNSGDLSL